MTHSRRRTPIIGHTNCESEKRDKTLARKRHRRAVHVAVQTEQEPLALREVSSTWDMGKDGKQYRHDLEQRDWGK